MSDVERTTEGDRPGLLERVGFPRALLWGYVGLTLFMVGDGVESNFLAKYFVDEQGFSENGASNVILFYGVFVALGSYLAGPLVTMLGAKRVMAIGAGAWVVLEVLFLAVGLQAGDPALIYAFYGARGVGYPLFAFAFLTWINLSVRRERRGRASGWFWFVFTGGLPVVGTAIAAISIPAIGAIPTFWLGLGLVVCGAVIVAVLAREANGTRILAGEETTLGGELRASISLLWRVPLIGLATGLRVINTGAQYGFFVALPFFLQDDIGFSETEYLILVTLTFGANVVMNPISGNLSDRFGWRRSIMWLGGVGCTIATLLVYFVPLAVGDNFLVVALVGVFFGVTLAGYVPLSAFMPSIVPESERGNAMGMYAFAAGFSTVVGPLVYSALEPSFGIAGVMYTFAGLYLLSAIAAIWLRHEADPGQGPAPAASPA